MLAPSRCNSHRERSLLPVQGLLRKLEAEDERDVWHELVFERIEPTRLAVGHRRGARERERGFEGQDLCWTGTSSGSEYFLVKLYHIVHTLDSMRWAGWRERSAGLP